MHETGRRAVPRQQAAPPVPPSTTLSWMPPLLPLPPRQGLPRRQPGRAMSLPPPAGTPPPYPAAATAHAGVLARRSGMPDWLTRYGFSGWMLLAGPVLLAIGVCCSYAAWLVLLDAWT